MGPHPAVAAIRLAVRRVLHDVLTDLTDRPATTPAPRVGRPSRTVGASAGAAPHDPLVLTVEQGNNVVVKWKQITPGTDDQGRQYEQSGSSVLIYAGNGKFSYEEDLLNMVHVLEDLGAAGWRPRPGFVSPPEHPNRDFSRPAPP